ncbi:DUF6489 family protein [Zavarzinia sp. CC-PAN008]|uniref:DUF6489 family protein n=1 Tax=Zavarzinia sp. CC-PAN008 TaxID=3243332 RepID=UPI003F749961
MKISIDIDVTPKEAREFLGLPDVEAVQQRLMADAEERLRSYMKAMEPEAVIKTWLPAGIQGFDTLQKAFWAAADRMSKPSSDRS